MNFRLSKLGKSRLVAWVTLFFFTSQPVIMAAGAIVDGTQPNVTVREESNGTEVVNIANPNSNGLSHNKYNQFNVGSNGLILSNSQGNYNSQLTGGMVMGNANLTNGSARIILNEVTAPNISHLNGKIEVGGNRADVIIANPNGIVGNNFGFINANRVVMTTGTPQMNGDNLTGFNVTGGNIAINGTDGMDAGTSKVELLSRTMQVNAKIQAGEIKAVSGKNDIAYTEANGSGVVTALAVDGSEVKPEVGIDIASLGGMYAGRITLVGTEKGVGVNSAGALTATGGNIDISNDGKITLKGATATGQVKVTATDSDVVNKGTMTGSSITVNGNTFTNDGKDALVSSGSINLNASDQIYNKQGMITSANNLTLTSQSVVNESGIIHTDQNLTINADEVVNKSNVGFVTETTTEVENKVIAQDIISTTTDVTTTTTVTSKLTPDSVIGKIEAGQNITINAGATGVVTNDKSDMVAGNTIVVNAGQVTNVGLELQKTTTAEKVRVREGWRKADDLLITPQGSVQETESIGMAGGRISAPNSVTITADTITNQTIGSQGAVVRDVIRPLDFTQNYALPATDTNYVIQTGATEEYLVKSEVTLTGGNEYISSDYLLDGLRGEAAIDPNTGLPVQQEANPKRLGDGFYEQELVTNQIKTLTDSPLLSGQSSSDAQYKMLMDNGIEAATGLKLQVGVPLTKAQQSKLNKDIVWFEERVISGEKVLVPVVYLSPKTDRQSGASIDSNSVMLKANHVQNSGTVDGKQIATIEATTLTNDRGRIIGNDLSIQVTGDMVNRNGEIHSDSSLVLKTDGNIINETTATDSMNATGQYSSSNSLSAPAIISTGGDLTLEAGENVVLTGSGVLAEGNVNIKAGKNVIGDTSVENYWNKEYTGKYNRNGVGFSLGGYDFGYMNVDRQTWSQIETGALIGAGKSVRIESGEDINLKGTTIQANENILTYSKGSTSITPGHSSFHTQQTGFDLGRIEWTFKNPKNKYDRGFITYWYQNGWHDGIDVVSPELYAGGKIQMFSENNITLQAAKVSSLDGIDIVARRDIDILADKDKRLGGTFTKKEGRYWDSYGREYVSPTQLVSDGDINIVAGYLGDFFGADGITPRDSVEFKIHDFESDHQGRLRIQGSAIQSGKRVNLQAITDVIVETINLRMEDFHKGIHKRSNGLSSKKTTRIDHTITNIASGSSIFGDSVNIQAGNDVKISGSEVLAVNDLDITAGNNIDITAAKSTQDDYHMLKVEKSGFSTSGITGVSYGKEMTKNTDFSHQEFYTASTVGSLNGNVNINAGGDVNVVGSAVQAVTGDINIEGDDVNIVSAVAHSDFHNRFEYKKTGITIAVSGGIIDPLNTAYTYANIAKDAKTDQLKTMAGAKAGLELNKAYESLPNSDKLAKAMGNVSGSGTSTNTTTGTPVASSSAPSTNASTGTSNTNSNGVNQADQNEKAKTEIKLNISIGTQSMSSKQDTYTTTNYGSSITAGGNVNIKARGDQENGKEGDVIIQGSHISGENVTIEAKDDVNIIAAQDTQNTKGSNKSSGGSIGVTVGLTTGQTSVGVSINGGKGKNRGDGVENIESTIDARDTLTIISGGDTNIIGSQVKGNTVKAEIDGDLNIVSLQDTENYKDSQTNWSASASTTGAVSGSYSNQKYESNYKSVNEQAGIFAGEGGFDITVGGNTNLVGGVIVSEADAEKNKLDTGTLTWSDIKNTSEYDSNTTGINFNKGPGVANKDKGLTPNFGGSSDKETSITGSGISNGTIITRDEDKQKQDVADLNRNPDGENQALDKPTSKDIVHEKEQAAAIFGEIGFDVAGKIIRNNHWAYDDPRSVALHGLIGGIMAEINGGNFGEGLTTAAINKIIAAKLAEKHKELGLGLSDIRWISAVLGGALTEGLFDGSFGEGAGIADSGTRNNLGGSGLDYEEIRKRQNNNGYYIDPSQIKKIGVITYDVNLKPSGNEYLTGHSALIVELKNGVVLEIGLTPNFDADSENKNDIYDAIYQNKGNKVQNMIYITKVFANPELPTHQASIQYINPTAHEAEALSRYVQTVTSNGGIYGDVYPISGNESKDKRYRNGEINNVYESPENYYHVEKNNCITFVNHFFDTTNGNELYPGRYSTYKPYQYRDGLKDMTKTPGGRWKQW